MVHAAQLHSGALLLKSTRRMAELHSPQRSSSASTVTRWIGPWSRTIRLQTLQSSFQLGLLVEGDAIAGERSCLTVAGRLLADKADVAVTLYKGVTHGFDVREKSFLSPLEFDAATTEAAIAATLEFLGPP